MIELTRLNGNKFSINSDLIKYVEAAPDTTLTLITGEKLLVVDSCESVKEQSLLYRAQVLRSAWPDALAFFAARLAQDAIFAAEHKEGEESTGSSNR